MRSTIHFQLLTLAAAAVFAPALLAADDDEVVVGPIVANSPDQAQMQQFAQVDFDQWMFQNVGSAKEGEQRLRTQVRLQLAELASVCQLTDDQRNKLDLAARGDVQRFLDEVDVLRRKFNAVKNDQNAANQMWQEIQPLQAKQARGLTGAGSLLMKTLPKSLSSEQAEQYETLIGARRKFRYQASIAVSLHMLEGTVPLKHEQREALQKVLLELPAPQASGQYDHYLIMYRLAALPPEKIQPLLDARQWTALKQQFNQYRGMREFLFQQGLLDREEVGQAAANEVQP